MEFLIVLLALLILNAAVLLGRGTDTRETYNNWRRV